MRKNQIIKVKIDQKHLYHFNETNISNAKNCYFVTKARISPEVKRMRKASQEHDKLS